MTPVKGRADSFPERVELLLRLFSPWRNKPLTYGELAEILGEGFSEDAVKGWVKRGEFSAAGRERIVEIASEHGIADLTAAWLREGTPPQPRKGGETAPGGSQGRPGSGTRGTRVGEPEIAYPGDSQDDDAAYLAYTFEALRALSSVERGKLGPGALNEMLEEVEKIGARFGPRAKEFVERQRERVRRGEPLGPDSTAAS